MRKLFGGIVAIILGLAAAPAGAGWVPGTPWATCSAPQDCGGALYVRRIHAADSVSISRRHMGSVRRVHTRPIAHRTVHHVVTKRVTGVTDGYARGFQYITDPREAAVTAWADIVNRDGYGQ